MAPSGHGRSLVFVPTCPASRQALSLLPQLPHLLSSLLPPPLAGFRLLSLPNRSLLPSFPPSGLSHVLQISRYKAAKLTL